jgi:small basic protein
MRYIIELIGIWLFNLVIPVQPYMQLIIVAIFVNTLFGTWIAVKDHEFKWLKLAEPFFKFVVLSGLLILIYQIQTLSHLPDWANMTGIAATIFGVREAVKADTNYEKIFGYSILKPLMDKIPNLKDYK